METIEENLCKSESQFHKFMKYQLKEFIFSIVDIFPKDFKKENFGEM